MPRSLLRYPVAFALLLMLSACRSVRIDLALDHSISPGPAEASVWPSSGSLEHGPQPPLQILRTIKMNAAPGARLAVLDSMLFIPAMNGRVLAYNLRSHHVEGTIKLPDNAQGQIAVHPEGYLLAALRLGHETLLCYDLRRGGYLWKIRAGLVWSTPVPADSSVYVASKFNHGDRYNLRDGKRRWRVTLPGQAYAAPAVTDDRVIFVTDNGQTVAVQRHSGAELWRHARTSRKAIVAPPVAISRSGLVYVTSLDSTLTALNLQDGSVRWQFRTGGSLWHAPAVSGPRVVVADGSGTLTCLDAELGTVYWQAQHETPFGTTPLIVGSIVYLGALDQHLHAYRLDDGVLQWSFELRGRVRTDPIVFGEWLITGSEDRFVYLLEPAHPEVSE